MAVRKRPVRNKQFSIVHFILIVIIIISSIAVILLSQTTPQDPRTNAAYPFPTRTWIPTQTPTPQAVTIPKCTAGQTPPNITGSCYFDTSFNPVSCSQNQCVWPDVSYNTSTKKWQVDSWKCVDTGFVQADPTNPGKYYTCGVKPGTQFCTIVEMCIQ